MSGRLLKHVRSILGEARRAAGECGITVTFVEKAGGKHPKLVFEGHGQRRVKPLHNSPRDADNARKMGMADIRRILREMAA